MSTIRKRADELKPDDVIAAEGSSFGGRIVVDAFPASDPNDPRIVVDAWSTGRHSCDRYWLEAETHVTVESALTLAQQHAEELADLVMMASAILRDWEMTSGSDFKRHRASFAESAQPVLDKIKPPEPPTLEEALALVENLAGGHSIDRVKLARELLDRARRAGVKV